VNTAGSAPRERARHRAVALSPLCSNPDRPQPTPTHAPRQAKGYAIAIASANGAAAKIKPVLRRIDGAAFSEPFFGSGAFQIGEADKARELRRIGEHFKTPAACMMLFDDGACAGGGWAVGAVGLFGVGGGSRSSQLRFFVVGAFASIPLSTPITGTDSCCSPTPSSKPHHLAQPSPPPPGAFNKRYADETGSVFRQVDGRRGVAWSDYQSAQEALESQCTCDA